MHIKRFFLLTFILLAFVTVTVIVTAYFTRNIFLQTAAERYGIEILNLDVNVSSASAGIRRKNLTLHNVKIGNPPAFSGETAIHIRKVEMIIGNINRNNIYLESFVIDGMNTYLEVSEQGTNLGIIYNLAVRGGSTQKSTPGPIHKLNSLTLYIPEIQVRNVFIHPSAELMWSEIKPFRIDDFSINTQKLANGSMASQKALQIVIINILERMLLKASEIGLTKQLEDVRTKSLENSYDGKGKLTDPFEK